ncbi:MAG: Gfo/Idh/MocA family protein [Rhabdochlamydiaceae bacterium]
MKILIIGLGSMGKRRIRNLLKLGYSDILGFDTREDRRKEVRTKYHVETVSSLKQALMEKPRVMIISTPPDLHLQYAGFAIRNNIDFFMEVNLISNHVKKIIDGTKKKSLIAYPSCTMRFHPIVKELKKMLDKKIIGRVLTVQHHTGHFLPNWHPWEDYRDFFVSRKRTGGARETIPVELVWLTYLFSDIQSVMGRVDKLSKLDANIDDTYQVILEFKNKITCLLSIDVIAIPSFRETKLIGENGTIICDFINGTIRVNTGRKWIVHRIAMGKMARGYKTSTPPETLYEEEIESFLNAVNKKGKYPFSLDDEARILKVLDKIEMSSKKGKKMAIN